MIANMSIELPEKCDEKNSTRCWKRHTSLEKTLIIFFTAAVLVVIVLTTTIVTLNLNSSNTCLSKGCIRTASEILDAIDSSVEPCDDFYQFACGNFIKHTFMPDDKVEISEFTIIGDKLQEQIYNILISETVDESDEIKPFKLAKDFFKLCMNLTGLEEQGVQSFIKIADSLGGWSVLHRNEWNKNLTWTWTDTIKSISKAGFSKDFILSFGISNNLTNSSIRLLAIDEAELGLSREYLIKGFDDKLVQAYYAFMVDVAVIFGADRYYAEKELLKSVKFEMELAKISLSSENRRNATAQYNPMKIAKVQEKYPYVRWIEYLNALLPDGLDIEENETIIVGVPQYFEDLGKLLMSTPNRVIANYLLWRVAKFSTIFLNEKLDERGFAYVAAFSGQKVKDSRWKNCVDKALGNDNADSIGFGLPISIGALYVRKFFDTTAKHNAFEMVNGIRAELDTILKTVSWMDSETRKSALDKAATMTFHIGYPDELLDNAKLLEFYKDVEIDSENFLESVLRLNVFGTDYLFNQLRKPFDRNDWVMYGKVADVNAQYYSIENSIHIPAGILQGKFFSADRPKYMNYGAIGYVIGHEITHGFDDEGRQFDLNGNLVDWWQEKTKLNYLARAACMIEQYGNYTEPITSLNLNGINTQGENIADNGGIKESYYAYQRWVDKNGQEPRLPGLRFSPQQLLWLSAAQTWCSVDRPESIESEITLGVHAVSRYRVLGSFSNMKEFSKDFNCPIGSNMNPINKCQVW